MAVIEASEAGGNANLTTSWVGGVVPKATDDVVLGEKSGSITISEATEWKSIEAVAAYKGTLKDATLTVKVAGKNAAGYAFRWLGGTFERELTTHTLAFEATVAGTYKIVSGGQVLGNIKVGGSSSAIIYSLEDALKGGEITHTGGAITGNGFAWELTVGGYSASGAKTKILNIEGSTVKLTGTGTIWTIAGSGLTLEAKTSTIDISDTSGTTKTFKSGELTAYGTVKFPTGGAAKLKIEESFTCVAIAYDTGLAGTTKKVVFKEGITVTVGEFLPTAGVVMGSSLNGMIWESSVAGKAFTIKGTGGIYSADYLALKDSHATTGTFYAGAHGTNTSGNEGWTFQTYHAQSLTATQASAPTFGPTTDSRHLTATQASAPTFGPTIDYRTLTVGQAQSAVKVASPTRALSVTQAQSVVRLAGPARSLSVAQGQAAVKVTIPQRTLSVTQAQTVPGGGALPRSLTRTLATTQAQGVSRTSTPSKICTASQGSSVSKAISVGRALATTTVASSALRKALARTLSTTQGSSAEQIHGVAAFRTLTAEQGSTATQTGAVTPLLTITQSSSATKVVNVVRILSASGGQSVSRVTVPRRTLTAEQEQAATKTEGKAVSETFSVGQGQSVLRVAQPHRSLSVTQGQFAAMTHSLARTLRVGQAQHVALARSPSVSLTLAQASSVSYERRIGKPVPAVQGSSATLRKAITRLMPLLTQGQEATVVGQLVIAFKPGRLASTVVWEGATSDTATGVSSSSSASVILTSSDETSITSSVEPVVQVQSGVE